MKTTTQISTTTVLRKMPPSVAARFSSSTSGSCRRDCMTLTSRMRTLGT